MAERVIQKINAIIKRTAIKGITRICGGFGARVALRYRHSPALRTRHFGTREGHSDQVRHARGEVCIHHARQREGEPIVYDIRHNTIGRQCRPESG